MNSLTWHDFACVFWPVIYRGSFSTVFVVGRMAAAGRGSGAACRSLLAAVIDFQFLLLAIFTVVTGVIVRLVIPVQRGRNKAGRGVLRHSTTPKGTGAIRGSSCQHTFDDPGRHNRTCQEAPPSDAAAGAGAANVEAAEHRIRAGAPGGCVQG